MQDVEESRKIHRYERTWDKSWKIFFSLQMYNSMVFISLELSKTALILGSPILVHPEMWIHSFKVWNYRNIKTFNFDTQLNSSVLKRIILSVDKRLNKVIQVPNMTLISYTQARADTLAFSPENCKMLGQNGHFPITDNKC